MIQSVSIKNKFMRRYIILVSALVFSVATFARELNFCGLSMLQTGYNFFAEKPIVNMGILGNFNRLALKMEIGGTEVYISEIQENFSLVYAHPSIGLIFKERCDFYILVGAIPWIGYEKINGVKLRRDDIWHATIEGGINIPMKEMLFLNLEAMYMFSELNKDSRLQNLTLRVGLGIDF